MSMNEARQLWNSMDATKKFVTKYNNSTYFVTPRFVLKNPTGILAHTEKNQYQLAVNFNQLHKHFEEMETDKSIDLSIDFPNINSPHRELGFYIEGTKELVYGNKEHFKQLFDSQSMTIDLIRMNTFPHIRLQTGNDVYAVLTPTFTNLKEINVFLNRHFAIEQKPYMWIQR